MAKIKKAAIYAKGIVPVVGMGATAGYGSDRYPYTVTAVNKTGKTIKVIQTNPIWENGKIIGYDESYQPNTGAIYTLRKDGYFYHKGGKARGGAMCLGYRSYYQDPSF